MLVFYRVLLVGFFSGVLYLVHALFMANVIAASAQYADDKEAVYQNVLKWQPDHKEALSQLSVISLQKKSYENAVNFARQAIQVDPTNGRAMSVLITAYDALGESGPAEKALHLATKLWPSHAYVRVQSSGFWAKRGDMEKMLVGWNVLLTRHSGFYKDLFPVLKALVKTENYQGLLQPYYDQPAFWWKNFFTYLTKQDIALETITKFYQKRLLSNSPVGAQERNAYVARLLKEKQWRLAYSSWVGGLEKQESVEGEESMIYDGSFEALAKPSAFSWNYRNAKNIKAALVRVRGADGKYAFKATFNKRIPITRPIAYQRLLLQPGQAYKILFKLKLNGLKNDQGLKWSVRCSDRSNAWLASSEPMMGRTKWSENSFEVLILEDGCQSQLLELITVSNFHHERFFQGSVLFDDFRVSPIEIDQKRMR